MGVVAGTGLAVVAVDPGNADLAYADPGAPDLAAAVPGRPAFHHGVASGDPLPDGVLLWTRVTPRPGDDPGTGLGPVVPVAWEVATDPRFRDVVRRGTTQTGPDRDHTIKVEVSRLEPATDYWYRFRCGQGISAVGRTRTAPAPDARVDRLRMAVVSCANLQAGWFTAYRHLAARDDIDVVVHLGDYFYEYGPGTYQARDVVIRPHDPPHEVLSLSDYRRRHAQYKLDPDLQALHAAAPWVVTWDDHESANDAWLHGAQGHTDGAEGAWPSRRAIAEQAYAEWMPVRYTAGGRLYRRLTFGRLASLSMLDLRSYRDRQPTAPDDPALGEADRTITGVPQMNFLLGSLDDRQVQWKLIGNPVLISPLRFTRTLEPHVIEELSSLVGQPIPADEQAPYSLDQWDGYPADRARVVGHLAERRIRDVVFLTGDIHSGWANEIPADPATYPTTGDSVAVELVCTSVTSDNIDDGMRTAPRTTSLVVERAVQATNPHVKYVDLDSHGYSVLEVTEDGLQMDWYVLADRTDPYSAAVWSTSRRVRAGSSRVRPAGRRLP
ncbi:UNVERIFIED_ORG: alkaline phosphatase [Bacillus sp. AZ43]